MRNYLLIFFLGSLPILGHTQKYTDFGIFGGTTTYYGDINQDKVFYSPGYAAGLLTRYNINRRHSVRFNAYYGSFTGSDYDFSEQYTPQRNKVSFSTQLVNLALQWEFNYLSFITGEEKKASSAYLTMGLGYSIIMGSSVSGSPYQAKNHFNVPFGLGYKINFSKKWAAGAEIGLRKTFNDRIDGVVNPLGNNLINNNDWYTFAGIFITYKIFKYSIDCPAYD